MKILDDQYLFASPRIRGIREQYKRARRFMRLARRCKQTTSRFRNLIAAVYPARAIVELMLEAAEKQELKPFQNKDAKRSREDFEKKLVPKLPHYYLLEKIRIHDFHRFGCIPPDPKKREVFWGGPIKLIANRGSARLELTKKGPQLVLTGNSSAKQQRSLYTDDGHFFDDTSGKFLQLDEILEDFLRAVSSVIADFERLHEQADDSPVVQPPRSAAEFSR